MKLNYKILSLFTVISCTFISISYAACTSGRATPTCATGYVCTASTCNPGDNGRVVGCIRYIYSPSSCGCASPFGGTVPGGSSITAYLSATAPCYSQVRTCPPNGGTLSGYYTQRSCTTPPPPVTCSLPWGGSISSGASVTAYSASSVPYGSSCLSQTRTCYNGSLSGSYYYRTCTVQSPASCSLPWGGVISSGSSVTAYQSSSATFPSSCVSQYRTCSNGSLSGTYTNQSCIVPPTTSIVIPSADISAYSGDTISFTGLGTPHAPASSISLNEFRLSNCSTGRLLSSVSSFNFSTTTAGTYTIYYRVRDNLNVYSTDCPSRTVTVTRRPTVQIFFSDP